MHELVRQSHKMWAESVENIQDEIIIGDWVVDDGYLVGQSFHNVHVVGNRLVGTLMRVNSSVNYIAHVQEWLA